MNNNVNNVGEKFLPIGTVVMLKGGSKRLMITGFCSIPAEDPNGVMYDYSGCMYPEGFISSDQTALFNHDQIESVYHLGLSDKEDKDFKIKLSQLLYSNSVVSESVPAGVQTPSTPINNSTQTNVESVPPLGPGLPGYNAPGIQNIQPVPVVQPVQPVQPVPVAQTVEPVPAPQTPAPLNIQFDENGVVTSVG